MVMLEPGEIEKWSEPSRMPIRPRDWYAATVSILRAVTERAGTLWLTAVTSSGYCPTRL
jgi:hypothetical protein